MATVQNAQIRQHFIRMGMPKKEIDSIMRDNVIMQKTHILSINGGYQVFVSIIMFQPLIQREN